MSSSVFSLTEALHVLRDACAGVDVAGAAPGELAELTEVFGALRRQVEAGFAPVAAEIARQSRRELGKDSFSRKQGFRSPAALISAASGASVGDAVKLMQVGEATAPRTNLVGDRLPAKHPHVADAVAAGRIGMAAASAIVTLLDRVVIRAGAEACERMEQRLAEAAPGLTPDQLQKLLLRAEAVLDPDGVEPREEERHAARSLVFRTERDGMTTLTARLDAESAAPVKAAIEGIVTGFLRRDDEASRGHASCNGAHGCTHTDRRDGADEGSCRQGRAGCEDDGAMRETNSIPQLRADALVALCRHGLGCEQIPTRPIATVIVRMSLDDLQNRTGSATIDGIDQPVSASAARRLAADARVIPFVLGGASETLDLGRGRRLFTPAQKLALGERDGGCAFCGAPPNLTVAHHIDWWERDTGPTDLSNGILLCPTCHHRIHDDGWGVRVDGTGVDAVPWFTPPPWLDPSRTPRRGGRPRFDLVA